MRIGIDTRLQNETGVGRYIRNLITYLPQLDTKNEYVFINPDIKWHTLEEQIKMPAVLNAYNLDLVHIPYFNVPVFYTKPFVVTIHDLIVNEYRTGQASTQNVLVYGLKRIGYQYSINHAVQKSCAIIVPSHATKDKLIELYPRVHRNKICVTYEGVDLKSANGKPSESEGKQLTANSRITNNKFFLYVGNAYPHKNVETLLKAFAQLNNPEIQLVIVGKKNYFTDRLTHSIKELDIADRIIFPGEIPDAELAWLYKHAQALVLPSLMEGFGLPALEAMQFRASVIASDIPVFHEICQQSAFYFNPFNVDQLTALVKYITSSAKKSDMQKKKDFGEKRAREFSWKKMVNETIKIYNTCL